jgi:hypothetical protein
VKHGNAEYFRAALAHAARRGEYTLQPCLRDGKRLIYPASCDECRAGGKCLAQLQPTDTQAELLARARARVVAERLLHDRNPTDDDSTYDIIGSDTAFIERASSEIAAALQSEREAAAAEARGAAISDAAQVAIEYRDEVDADQYPDVGDPEYSLGQGYAANVIAKRILALASPASKDDLEDDVKHGNAEYFRAALAHAAAEARRATLRRVAKGLVPLYRNDPVEIARLCDEELDRTGNLLGWLREEAALASPAPQEETR